MATTPTTIEDYVAARRGPVAELLEALRQLVKATLPEAKEGMKWGAPVFFDARGEPIIYLYGGRDHANLGFVQGAELKDPEGILEGTGKSGRHVKVFPGEPIPGDVLKALIRQSAKQ